MGNHLVALLARHVSSYSTTYIGFEKHMSISPAHSAISQVSVRFPIRYTTLHALPAIPRGVKVYSVLSRGYEYIRMVVAIRYFTLPCT